LGKAVPPLPEQFFADDRRLSATERDSSVMYSAKDFKDVPTIAELRDFKEGKRNGKPTK
jgi:hypothetical protein